MFRRSCRIPRQAETHLVCCLEDLPRGVLGEVVRPAGKLPSNPVTGHHHEAVWGSRRARRQHHHDHRRSQSETRKRHGGAASFSRHDYSINRLTRQDVEELSRGVLLDRCTMPLPHTTSVWPAVCLPPNVLCRGLGLCGENETQ